MLLSLFAMGCVCSLGAEASAVELTSKTTEVGTNMELAKEAPVAKKEEIKVAAEIVAAGDNVQVHYTGTFPDGKKFDSSLDRGETLGFKVGAGQMIKGFDAGVVGMTVGEKKQLVLSPDEAYGQRNEGAISKMPRSAFPKDAKIDLGATFQAMGPNGRPAVVSVVAIVGDEITLDHNSPMAGKTLHFDVEMVEIKKA